MTIQRLHGDEGPLWIASRISALAGDRAGVEHFRHRRRRRAVADVR